MSTITSSNQSSRKPHRIRTSRLLEAKRVASELDRMCSCLQPGDKIPTHTILMEQLGASQRTVLAALEDLLRAGRIIRRQKAGTFVAKPTHAAPKVAVPTPGVTTIVAIAHPDYAYFSRTVEVLFQLAKNAAIAVAFIPADEEWTEDLPQMCGLGGRTAYVVIGHRFLSMAEAIIQAGHRCVLLAEPIPGAPLALPTIHADAEIGGYLCTQHLLSLGHRRIGFAMTDDTLRWNGHIQAINEAVANGVAVESTFILQKTIDSWAETPADAVRYFNESEAPTAISLWNDNAAMELTGILHRAGIQVPEQVSLVGYDNLPAGENYLPPITTIDPQIRLQLRTALRLLTQESPPSSQTEVIVTPMLIQRSSTQPPVVPRSPMPP